MQHNAIQTSLRTSGYEMVAQSGMKEMGCWPSAELNVYQATAGFDHISTELSIQRTSKVAMGLLGSAGFAV